jgi:DNA-binding SARP family transcriptional activator
VTPQDKPTYLLLGPVSAVDADGEPVAVGGAQRRAVLAQLVLAEGRTVSIDALCIGLWGDDPPPTAHKAIQVHISKLRQVLPAGSVLTEAPGYAIDPSATSDLDAFESMVTRAAAERAAGRPSAAAGLLHEALALWRGPPLADVADFPFADGPLARLDELRQHALEERLDADLAVGRHAALIGELEVLVREHPLRERLWALLMTALYRNDRQAEALDTYRRARELLVEELGLEPGPELRLLERRILEQSLDPPPMAEPSRGTDEVPETRAPAGLRPPGPVVGRAQPLERLRSAFEAASGGAGGIVAVRGDEGLGKSTVIAELVSTLDRPALVVAGRGGEHLAVPFGPWVEVLRQLGAGPELELLIGAPTGERDDSDPSSAEDDSPERYRVQLFDGVVARLRDLAGDRPVVVVLDDLHWIDDASITLLLHAIGELESAAVLFLVAWRDREVATGHPVTRLVHRMTRAESAMIDLPPLDHGDVVDLLVLRTGVDDRGRADDVASRILEVTAGIPLFVSEVIGDVDTAAGTLLHPDAVGSGAPEIVRSLVARRLTQAGVDATTVADGCSILSEPFAPLLVHQVIRGADIEGTLIALDELVAVGILREQPFGYGFTHDTFRHAVDATLRAGRRQSFHAAALESLRHEPVPPAVLAHHAEQAGPLVAVAELVQLLDDAGADAVRRGAFLDAAGFYQRAADRREEGARAPALLALADALWRAGDIGAAKDIAAQVVARAQAGSVPEDVVTEAVVLHGTFGAGYGVDPDSIVAADDALELVEDPELRARLLIAQAYHLAMWGSPTSVAIEAVRRAGSVVPDPCSDQVEGELLFAEGLALVGTAELAQRFDLARRLVDLGDRTGSLRVIGRGLRLRSLAEMSAGLLGDLDRTLDDLVDIAERTGSWLYRSDAWRWRIASALAAGDDDRAAADLDELERVSASPLAGRAFAGTQHLLLSRSRGELDRCLALVDGLLAVLPDDPARSPDRRLADLFRLVILVEMGRVDEARAGFEALRLLLDLDVAACRRYQGELAFTAQLVADLEVAELVPPLLARLEPYRGQLLVLSWGEGILGSAERYLAALESLGAGATDVDAFQRALDLEAAAGASVEVARTRARWGWAVDRAHSGAT